MGWGGGSWLSPFFFEQYTISDWNKRYTNKGPLEFKVLDFVWRGTSHAAIFFHEWGRVVVRRVVDVEAAMHFVNSRIAVFLLSATIGIATLVPYTDIYRTLNWPLISAHPCIWPPTSTHPCIWPPTSDDPCIWPPTSVDPCIWPPTFSLVTYQPCTSV